MGTFDIRTEKPCNFSNLTYLLVICHMGMPLLGVPLTWLLLPKQRLSEDLLGEKKIAKSKGIVNNETFGHEKAVYTGDALPLKGDRPSTTKVESYGTQSSEC